MAVEGLGNDSSGIAFLVSAGIMYEIMAAACSSPQTTELNAAKRADTLMKWVKIGAAQGIFFMVLAAFFDKGKRAAPILAGGTLALALQYGLYVYAKSSGLSSDEPGTEEY